MKERPIIFSGPMVRAILDGTKTQTRRAVTRRNSTVDGWPSTAEVWAALDFDHEENPPTVDDFFCEEGAQYLHVEKPHKNRGWQTRHRVRCRIEVGDLLWVREGHRKTFDIDGRDVLEYRCGGTRLIAAGDNGKSSIAHGEHRVTSALPRWRPSIHMPRWASRLTLRVTNVRVQRVQDISEEDTRAEGTAKRGDGKWHGRLDGEGRDRRDEYGWYTPWSDTRHNAPAHAFRSAWNHINAKRGHPWESNPWVWAVTFEVA